MELANALFGAIFVVVFIQTALHALKGTYDLNFVLKKSVIVSKSVLCLSFVSAVVAFLTGWLKWKSYGAAEMVLNILLLGCMGVTAVTDWKKHVIPNRLLAVMAALWVVVVTVGMLLDASESMQLLFQSVFGGLMGGIIFFVSYLLVKKQLGAGDVKLAAVMGLYLTSQRALTAYLLGTVICCVYSLILVARKKLGWKDGVALAPFLMLGVWLTLLIA